MPMTPTPLGLVCLTLFFATGCSYPKVWREAEDSLELPTAGVKQLACTTMNGNIAVQAGPSAAAACQIKVKRRGGGEDATDAAAALAAIRVVHASADGQLTLGWEWSVPKQHSWAASVSFAMVMPKDRAVQLETSNGTISIAGVEAQLGAHTSNGSIKIEECLGDWDVATSNGEIEATGTPSNVNLKTSNGSIMAKLATKGPVNGKLKTSNGRVDLSLAAQASTRVKAETSNGSITSEGDWKVHDKGKTHLDASRQGGTGTLLVDTSNGSIRIE